MNDADIVEHLPYLAETVKRLKAKTILELGVREGCSTKALLKAAEEVGAILVSIDWTDCSKVIDHPNWIFIRANGGTLAIKAQFDIIFIDTSHNYPETLFELGKYSPMLKTEGVILLHDTISSMDRVKQGVYGAIQDFMKRTPGKWCFENRTNNNGLGILKRIGG